VTDSHEQEVWVVTTPSVRRRLYAGRRFESEWGRDVTSRGPRNL